MSKHPSGLRIVHPTDFSDCAGKALELATDLGARLNARVDVAHVLSDDIAGAFPDLTTSDDLFTSEVRKRLRETLRGIRAERQQHLRERLETLCPPGGQPRVFWGEPYAQLREHVDEYDLVVMGAHGANPLDNLVLGGLAGRLVRSSPVPVLTVRDEAESPKLERVLVATDFSDAAKHAWQWTERLAEAGVKRVAAHIIPDPVLANHRPYYETTSEALELFAKGECEHRVLGKGRPVRELQRVAHEVGADAIVIGLKPHTVLSGWLLGGHADAFMRSSPVPILSVPTLKAVEARASQHSAGFPV